VAEAIFLDVLPKFGFTALEAGLNKFKAASREAGKIAGDSLTGETDTALKRIQASYTSAANSATDAAKRMSTAGNEVDAANRKMVTSGGQVEVAIKKLSETLQMYAADSSQVIAAENRVVDAWARSDIAAKRHADSVLASNAAIAKSSEASAAAVTAHNELTTAQAGATASTLAVGRAFNTVGVVSAGAFAAAMFESAKAAGNFEQSQTRLVSSAGETHEGLKVVSDGILKLAGDVGYSAGELSQGMYTVESAGFRGADGLKVMTAAAQGAKAENADLTKVNDGLTTSLTDFHLGASDAGTVMSKLVTAVGLSKANFEEFTGSLHSVEPVAAAAHLSLDDVYGSLARITQSGTSADQATQNMADAIRHLQGPTDVQAASMAKFGINVEDVQQKLSSRGLAGTMQYLSDTIRNQLDPAGNVSVSALNENAQAAQNAADMITKMSPAAAQVAQDFANGAISRKDFTGAIKASNAEDAAQLSQFGALELKLDGFSKQYKNGRSLLETYGQAMKEVTGTVAGANVAFQLSGDHAEETNRGIQAIANTTVDADGKVKGFAETQETFNARMADAKAAFGAAAITLGNDFLPTLKGVADELADSGRFLADHKAVLQGVTITVGGLGAAWVITKAAMALGSLVSTIGTGLATIGGFVWGLAGKYDALAVSANAAAVAEERAAAGGFAKGGAAGATARGLAGAASAATGVGLLAWGSTEASDAFNNWADSHPENERHDNQGRTPGQPGYRGGGREGGSRQAGPSGPTNDGSLPGVGPHGGRALPINHEAAARSAAAQAAVDGTSIPGADFADAAAAAAAARPDITAPGVLTPGEDAAAAAKRAKAPAGSRDDPLWISSSQAAGGKGGGTDVYNPFSQFQSQGFTPASVVGLLTTWALNEAAGNPYGKLANDAKNRGDSPGNPMYVTSVDVDKAQADLTRAQQQYGPDSEQAQTAAKRLAGTQAAVGTTGGYFDPLTGGISAHDRTAAGGAGVPAGPGAEKWRATASAMFDQYSGAAGIPASQKGAWVDAMVRQIDTESHGDPRADNPNDPNGRGGTQHVSGLLQYLPSTFANSAGRLTGITDPMNPEAQIAGLLLAGKNADGSPAGIGNGVGWGPRGYSGPAIPLPSASPPPAPPGPRSLIGGGSSYRGGDGAVLPDLSSLLGLGGGRPGDGGLPNSPILPRPGGGGLGIGGGAAGRGNAWPHLYGDSTHIGAGAGGVGGPSAAARPVGGGGGFGLGNSLSRPQTTPSGGRPASGGTGKGGGTSIGATAASIAGPALDALAPGASIAAQKGGQLLDRAIGYAGQLAGIGISGLFETFGLNDSALADPQKSVIGRLAGGLAGAHKNAENVAGQTQPPLKPPDPEDGSPASGKGKGPAPGPQPLIGTMNVTHSGDANGQQIAQDIDRRLSSGGVGSTRGS
jgi:hypothetical protein